MIHPHLLAISFVLSATAVLSAKTDSQTKPNILFILADDQGYADVGINGHPILHTPNMDRIANEGLRFTQFQASSECSPTRASLMSGRNHLRVGVTHTFMGNYYLPGDVYTVAEMMRDAGYETAMFGKWHLGEHRPCRPQDQGFDHTFIHRGGALGQALPDFWGNGWFDPKYIENDEVYQGKGFATDILFGKVLDWLKARDSSRPFYMYLAPTAPHGPYTPPKEASQRFVDMGLDPNVAGFYGLIESLDQNLGRLLDYLDESGLAQNTLVIYMGDNGTAVSHHKEWWPEIWNAGLEGGKAFHDEGGTRVPCFIRWPLHIAPGRVSNEVGAHYDFFPTFMEIAGGTHPQKEALDGQSLVPIFADPEYQIPDRLIFNSPHLVFPLTPSMDGVDPLSRISLRSAKYKYRPGNRLYSPLEDPGQHVNLASRHPELTKMYQKKIRQFWEEIRPVAESDYAFYVGEVAGEVTEVCAHDYHPLNAATTIHETQRYAQFMNQWYPRAFTEYLRTGEWPKSLTGSETRLSGYWSMAFRKPGTYRFSGSAMPEGHRGVVRFKEGTARLKIDGNVVWQSPVSADDQEVIAELQLPKSDHATVEFTISGQLPTDDPWGVIYCNITRLK